MMQHLRDGHRSPLPWIRWFDPRNSTLKFVAFFFGEESANTVERGVVLRTDPTARRHRPFRLKSSSNPEAAPSILLKMHEFVGRNPSRTQQSFFEVSVILPK